MMEPVSQQRPPTQPAASHGQALPSIASLTSSLTPTEQSPVRRRQPSDAGEPRDSGNWSLTQSKHSSGVSNTMGLQLHNILNADESPSRNSVPNSVPQSPSSARYPSGLSSNSALQQQQPLPSVNHGFDNRASFDAHSQFDSRRSSVDSRMNASMNQLAIQHPSSPYDSQNASRASLVSNLQQQRGITPADSRPNGASPLSPLGARAGTRAHQTPRQAPVINPNPRSVSGMPDPMAAAPTKGYAWAFPGDFDPEERRGSSSGESSVGHSVPSRQNSFAASMGSSIFTADSSLPAGQKRLDDDIPTTHHHSMQHRSVTNLQNADHAGAGGSGNYSRTPELRVTHKIAERKRRSEMKNLFDKLNSILPNSPGNKSSKWEILTKAIEYIENLTRSHDMVRSDNLRMRPELEQARRLQEENELLKSEVATMWQHLQRLDPGSHHVYGSMTSMLGSQNNAPQAGANVLPPLSHQQQQTSSQNQQAPVQAQPPRWGAPPQTAMQGVEYGGIRPYEQPHR